MGRRTRALGRDARRLEALFATAYVMDIDLSAWAAKKAAVVVSSPHVGELAGRRDRAVFSDVFVVSFSGVTDFSVGFPAEVAKNPAELAWAVLGCRVKARANGTQELVVECAPSLPELKIAFSTVSIRELLGTPLRRRFPAWSHARFLRGGFGEAESESVDADPGDEAPG